MGSCEHGNEPANSNNTGNLPTSLGNIGFWRKTLLHEINYFIISLVSLSVCWLVSQLINFPNYAFGRGRKWLSQYRKMAAEYKTGIWSQTSTRIFLFATASVYIPLSGPSSFLSNGYRALFPPDAILPEHEVDHSPPPTTKFQNAWSYTSTPQCSFMT
jgi:hypothetical protein